MVCRGPERLYCRSREAPAGRDAPARRTAEAAHANRVPRPPRLRRRRRGSGPPVLSTPAASTIPRVAPFPRGRAFTGVFASYPPPFRIRP